LDLILSPALALHLLAINIGAAGPLLCIWLHLRGCRRSDTVADVVGHRLAIGSLLAASLGMAVGLIMLAILWVGNDAAYMRALQAFPASRYRNLGIELVFYFVCLVPFVLLWQRSQRHPFWHAWLALLAASDLLYHFPPLMAILSTLATRKESFTLLIDRAGYHRLLVDPEIVSRTLHSWMASIAVAGIALMVCAATAQRAPLQDRKRLIAWGARIAMAATLVQLPVGVTVLLQLPGPARLAMMGGEVWTTGLLVIGLIASLGLLHQLASVALGRTGERDVLLTCLALLLTVSLMSAMRRRARELATPRAVESRTVRHTEQWEPPAAQASDHSAGQCPTFFSPSEGSSHRQGAWTV